MIVNFSIPLPVLTAGEVFRVSYRLVGAGTWTPYADQTNAPFTIDLPAGYYELMTQLIRADGEECPPVIQTFTVIEVTDDYCVDATITMVLTGAVYSLDVEYTGPTTAPCNYILTYGPNGGAQTTLNYTSALPTSPFTLPASNVPYSVTIQAVDCNGNVIPCYDEVINPPAGGCTPAVLSSVVFQGGGGAVNLKFTFIQSTPPSNPITIAYSQNNTYTAGVGDAGGVSAPTTPGQTVIYVPVSPNYSVQLTNSTLVINYQGTFVDGCNISHKWEASFDLT